MKTEEEAKQRAANYMRLKGALDVKEETLEEAAERLYPGVDRQVDRMLFIKGAEWQEEKIPSIIEEYLETAFISKEQGYVNPKEWFEQFKKK
jgi:hypothetical protein